MEFLKFRQFLLDFNDFVGFDKVTYFNIIEIVNHQAAFKTEFDFLNVVFKAFERGQSTDCVLFDGEDNNTIADNAEVVFALDLAFLNVATCHRTDFRDFEHVAEPNEFR
jgi:hypothetical protein